MESIEKFFTVDCRYFEEKMFFFSLTEKWMVSKEDDPIEKSFSQIKNLYENQYYQTLFHLLACPFCHQKNSIIREKSHPDLWRLRFPNEIEMIERELAKNVLNSDPALYYLRLLYNKIERPQKIVPFLRFFNGFHYFEEPIMRRAAGSASEFPSQIPLYPNFLDGAEILLQFKFDSGTFQIGLQGDNQIRSLITIKIIYYNDTTEEFSGAETIGGAISISQKEEHIKGIEIIYKYLFSISADNEKDLNEGHITAKIANLFRDKHINLSLNAAVKVKLSGSRWSIKDNDHSRGYPVVQEYSIIKDNNVLKVFQE